MACAVNALSRVSGRSVPERKASSVLHLLAEEPKEEAKPIGGSNAVPYCLSLCPSQGNTSTEEEHFISSIQEESIGFSSSF